MRVFRNRTFVATKNLIIRKSNIASLYDLEHSLKRYRSPHEVERYLFFQR